IYYLPIVTSKQNKIGFPYWSLVTLITLLIFGNYSFSTNQLDITVVTFISTCFIGLTITSLILKSITLIQRLI
ncbi:MAG: hypothetical protein J6583_06625, partial [Gilliamella sp.]|nr:hypothetical protein [Gilliamella sp.]